ncbi:MAG: hypothetical protein Kow001_19080 [Acidobacteriota bacterium]
MKPGQRAGIRFGWIPLTLAAVFPHLLAGVIPGRWEKVAALVDGTPVRIELVSRERIEGLFRGLGPGELQMETSAGTQSFPRHDVIRVERLDRLPPPRRRWLIMGAGSGLGFAVPFMDENARLHYEISTAANGLILGVVGAGIGLTASAILDARDRSRAPLYEARQQGSRP